MENQLAPVLDLRGLKCPKPALHTKKHLNKISSGEAILVICTDELSVIDIPHLVSTLGHKLLSKQVTSGEFHFLIAKS